MDFAINLFVLILAVYFAKESYDQYKIVPAMFWSLLVGWDLHTILYTL
jgi:hypothetical protein